MDSEHTQLVARPWKRFGHNRIYFNLSEDKDAPNVGYYNVTEGTLHLEDDIYLPYAQSLLEASGITVTERIPLEKKTQDPSASQVNTPDTVTTTAEPEPFRTLTPPPVNIEEPLPTTLEAPHSVIEPIATQPDWQDLQDNEPGSGVRAKAAEVWDESKANSRFLAYASRIMDVHTSERAWRIGAKGEERVGKTLNELRQHGWRVLHSVPIGANGADIDHLLIGPGGVYMVNTKTHPEKKIYISRSGVYINGSRNTYIRDNVELGKRAQRYLSKSLGEEVFVMPMIVFTMHEKLDIQERPNGIHIQERISVKRFLRKRPLVLSEAQISHIYETARRSTTWTGKK